MFKLGNLGTPGGGFFLVMYLTPYVKEDDGVYAMQNIVSYHEAVCAILVGGFRYSICVLLPVKFYDLTIFQFDASSLWLEGSFAL